MHISFCKHILRFKQPAGTSRGVYHTRTVWYITASDDQSNWGIGECAPLQDLSCDAMPDEQYEAVLTEACHNTAQADGLLDYNTLKSYPSILFGLETALLSLNACRRHGRPFHLYDNTFSRGETGTVINGLVWMGTHEEMRQRMEEKLAAGFHCIKIKIGAIDWEREISLIRSLRQQFPKDVVEIRVDANGGFSPEVAMSRLEELARYDIHSIEQPIRQLQWTEMAQLCRKTPIPIALDEELIGVNDSTDKVRLLDTIRPQYIILKPSLHGGLAGSEEWIRLARERGIGYWVTSALESNVGLNAIAQWQAELKDKLSPSKDALATIMTHFPQGLGTGQLFVENYDAIHLSIEGERLWCGTAKDRSFEEEFQDFLKDWHSPSPSICVHTSGSTGTPKTILVEKERMRASARMTIQHLDIPRGATSLLCMPLRYIAGKMMVVRALEGGWRLLRQTPTSTPDLTAIPPVFFLAVTPMQALCLLRDERQRPLFTHIPRVIIGGGAISAELHTALQQCEGEAYSTYGMTETLSHIAMRRLNGPEQQNSYTLLEGVQIERGEDDVLLIDAPALCPDRLTTNDICDILPNGTFRILGRRDNIVCSGGIKLSLEAIEAKLENLCPSCQLTAVPDPLLGEALTMLYCGECPDERTLREHLDRYEYPRHFIKVDMLPTTETGKPARAQARKVAECAIRNT